MKTYRAIAAVISILMLAISTTGCTETTEKQGKAKYIFLFIGDGMGNSQVAVTEAYLSWKEGKLGGAQLSFTQFPVYGTATSHSANSNITDSAAAGTAIATGVKTNNGYLGVDSEGNPAKSMSYDLKEDGYSVGIISSVPINHATPGSFYGHNIDRGEYYAIIKEIPATGFEYFASSGILHSFGPDGNSESTTSLLEQQGYDVCFGKADFEQSRQNNDRIVLCQEYNKDVDPVNYNSTDNKPEGEITLAEMVQYGIDFLGTEEPFFIMCEGGEIDWACHGNKALPMINATIAFSDAVAVAYEFYKQHPDETLIVVTADHATGGVALGTRGKSRGGFAELEKSWAENNNSHNLDAKANTELNERANIGWTTGGHTGEPVPVYAIGVGAEKFGGRMDNTDIKGKILGE